MKKMIFTIATVVIVLGSLTETAAAQNRVLGRAVIPFSFAANGHRLEAGVYQLRQIGQNFVRFEEVRTLKGITLLSTQNIAASSTTQLVFRGYGTRRFLSAVVAPAYEIVLPKSDPEKEMEESLANATIVTLQVKH